jgi:hypothetical protein
MSNLHRKHRWMHHVNEGARMTTAVCLVAWGAAIHSDVLLFAGVFACFVGFTLIHANLLEWRRMDRLYLLRAIRAERKFRP